MQIEDVTLSYPCVDFNKSLKVHHYYFKHVLKISHFLNLFLTS